MGEVRRLLRPFGAEVRVVTEHPELLAALAPAVRRMPRDGGSTGTYEISLTLHSDGVGDPAWPTVTVDDSPDRLLARCGTGELRVDHRAARASVDVPRALAAIPDALRCLVEGAVWSLLIGGGQLHAVHAAMVVAPGSGHGLLLRGESGAGKSTVTYACMRDGFGVVSDDWSYGVAGAPPDRMYGYPWRIFLMPDTVTFFPELSAFEPVPHPSVDRRKLAIEPSPARRRAAADLDAVVFLSRDAPAIASSIGLDEAVERWWNAALPTERERQPAEWIASLLNRPCFVVGRDSHPNATAQALRGLPASLT